MKLICRDCGTIETRATQNMAIRMMDAIKAQSRATLELAEGGSRMLRRNLFKSLLAFTLLTIPLNAQAPSKPLTLRVAVWPTQEDATSTTFHLIDGSFHVILECKTMDANSFDGGDFYDCKLGEGVTLDGVVRVFMRMQEWKRREHQQGSRWGRKPNIEKKTLALRNANYSRLTKENESPLDGSQGFAVDFVGFDHLPKLSAVDIRGVATHSENKKLDDEMFVPPSRVLVRMVGSIVMFGRGWWVLMYRRGQIRRRTAILALLCLFGGLTLALWSA
jgi:hypothetical protein